MSEIESSVSSSFADVVRSAALNRLLYLPHAIEQMNMPDRMITTNDVRAAVFDGEIIEEYPNDVRGHSCLMLGISPAHSRPIHLVCAPKGEYLAITTAYIPDREKWSSEFTRRKGQE